MPRVASTAALGLFNFESDWGLAGVGHAGANFGFVSWAACVSGDCPVVVVVLVNRRGDSFGLPRPLVMAALSD